MKTEKLISDPTLFFQEKKHVVNCCLAYWRHISDTVLGQL
jgi:hypothetical protein